MRTFIATWLLFSLTACDASGGDTFLSDSSVGDANDASVRDAREIDWRVDPVDSDGDGMLDRDEGREDERDSDGDGIADYLDTDSDNDGLSDEYEGTGDVDDDSVQDYLDPINNSLPPELKLEEISTEFNTPIGIDYHAPTNSVIMSVNYPTGDPVAFERVEADGSHHAFSELSGLTEEVKIATVRKQAGTFMPGELVVGNGVDGQIVRISADGTVVQNPWVDLPGEGNGLMRGGFHFDDTGEFGNDLVVVTTLGEVWRITDEGVSTKVVDVDVHLEGVITVPNLPARFGPLASKILAGAETAGVLYVIDADGTFETLTLGVAIEDIDWIAPKQNFFGVNFGSGNLLGAGEMQWRSLVGDILLTQEHMTPGQSALFCLHFNGEMVVAEPIPLDAESAAVTQWEHVTFAPAGIQEIPPLLL